MLTYLKLTLYCITWFVMVGAIGGPLSLFITSALKQTYTNKWILIGAFAGFWLVVIGVYYAAIFYKTSITPPYDGLSKLSILLTASLPFLITFILAFWIYRHLRFGW